MIKELKELTDKRKKSTKKVNKQYKRIIISIIITLVACFVLPRIPFLQDFYKLIDGLWMKFCDPKAIITPAIFIGTSLAASIATIINTVKLYIEKIKLNKIENEEIQKINELKDKIDSLNKEKELIESKIIELTKENEKNKEQINELIKEKQQLLERIKKLLESTNEKQITVQPKTKEQTNTPKAKTR